MSDPIALHSKPLSNPLDSSAINQPAAAGQFQQLSTQPHDTSNQMPVRTDDTGKQSPLSERNVRQPAKDAFLSGQEAMIKASRQLLANYQQSLQTYKDRLHSLGIDSRVTPTSHQPTLAHAAKPTLKTDTHVTITSDQAVSVSNAAPVTEQNSTTTTNVSSAKSDSEHTGDIKGGTIKVTTRTRSADKGPDTKVTTTSIVTKTVTTTTTETLHDQPTSPSLREILGASTSAPERTDSLKTLPGLGEITPAADHVSEPASRRTSFDTAKRDSLSSTESADFQIASSVVIDPDMVLTPGRSREMIFAHGDKKKLYSRADVPENSTVRDLQEQIENEVTNFRKDKKRSKMLIEISSCYKQEDGKEDSTLYASYEGVRQGLVKRQSRPPAAEIASILSTMLVEKEQKADEKSNQLQNGLPKEEEPGGGENEQTMVGQIKDKQAGDEQGKAEQSKTEQDKTEQDKTEQDKTEQSKTEKGKTEKGKAEKGKAEKGKAEKGKAEQSKSEQSKTEQSKTEKGKAEQSKTEQGKAEQSKAEQNKAEQSKTEQSKTEQSKTEQSKSEQSKTEQSKSEQTRDARDNSEQPS